MLSSNYRQCVACYMSKQPLASTQKPLINRLDHNQQTGMFSLSTQKKTIPSFIVPTSRKLDRPSVGIRTHVIHQSQVQHCKRKNSLFTFPSEAERKRINWCWGSQSWPGTISGFHLNRFRNQAEPAAQGILFRCHHYRGGSSFSASCLA